MKRFLHSIMLAVVFAPFASHAQQARTALAAGSKEFEGGAFDKAAAHFEEAAARAEEQKLDPAVAHYNRGNSLYKMQDFAGADQAYQNALRTTDMGLAPDGYYNRGNALTAQALQLEQQQKMEESIGLLDQALAMYEKSMLLNPGKTAAKANYELVTLKKKELEQQQQEQQQKQDQEEEEQKDNQQQQQDQPQQEQDQQEQNQEQQNQQQQEQRPQEQQFEEQKQPQPKPSNEMTEEEAEMMLDSMKNDEKNQREQIQMILGRPQPVDKDW